MRILDFKVVDDCLVFRCEDMEISIGETMINKWLTKTRNNLIQIDPEGELVYLTHEEYLESDHFVNNEQAQIDLIEFALQNMI